MAAECSRDKKTKAAPGLWWLAVAAVVVFVAIVRIRLLHMPLERDEGEFAYVGQLILQGIAPFKLACNMKLPGIYLAYTAIMAVFGQTDAGIHFGFLLVNAGAIVLVYLLGKRLFGQLAGVTACATYAVMSLSWPLLGSSAHATHFVVLFALGGILLLLRALETDRRATYLGAGLLLGTAFTMKQPGIVFPVFAVLFVAWSKLRSGPAGASPSPRRADWREAASTIGILLVGAVIPIAIVFVWMWAAGVFDRFWFWTVQYGRVYATLVPRDRIWRLFAFGADSASGPILPLWILSGVGLTTLVWDKTVRPKAVFLLGLLVFSFAGVAAGFYFRNHYFVLMLPAVALLAGCAVGSLGRLLERTGLRVVAKAAPVVAFLAVLAYPIHAQWDYLFTRPPEQLSRDIYSGHAFPEMREIGKYIQSHSRKNDTVAVMGSEPEICFYSGLHSATGYIYVYPLMEKQPYARQMQEDMIREIEAAKPKYIVFVVCQLSWCRGRQSCTRILEWLPGYAGYYEQVGLVDVLANDQAVFYWGKDAADREPTTNNGICVIRRTD